MKSAAIAAAVLASVAVAQPHNNHRRHHQHAKRDLVIEWETVMETVTVLVDEFSTETIYPTHAGEAKATSASSDGAAQFYQAGSTSSTPTTTPIPVVASPTVVAAASPTTLATSVTEAPVPVITYAPTTQAESPTTTSTIAAATTTAASSGSGSSPSGTQYSGDLTYYQVGMGACGYDDSGLDMSSNIVALDWRIFGTLTSYGVNQPANPLCDKTITISINGKTAQATVRDKCAGCTVNGVDVSQVVFEDLLGSTDVGRTKVEWWFN